ncbi:uncharacterized protein CDV56_107238 [Aspergillus thermomutatus]|uniref:Uncharacterized protein n=1 Tax=Aspergillus thermomutatus TaxID=41047 RepID=A0A397GY14_ASPTH|nr:uncharacterized protein CDV56_107238 [Aspergillus thermomutatus]RHZ55229.1 hypothetical protein CDV56_107238 [Aspergillus thermomutatus]
MASPDLDLDVAPIPRSREENQERAFIAASRRKDRSLDARLESANRASMLHKKRTGKALHITKEIVEREAMYEEIDERYQEKRIRMLQAQNLHIEEQLNRQLLAALAVRTNGIQQRRAASSNAHGPVNGVRKMSLDLSGLRSSFSESTPTGAMTSPMVMDHHSYMLPPSYNVSPQSSCVAPEASYPEMVPGSSSTQIPSYLANAAQQTPTSPQQQAAGPQQFRPSWAGFQPQQYQEQLQQHPQFWNGVPTRQFRDRLASAPEIPVHGLPSVVPAAPDTTTLADATYGRVSHHTRVRSEPDRQFLAQARFSASGSSSPKMEMVSTETLSTPDLCATPGTPHSPTSMGNDAAHLELEAGNKEGEVVFSSHQGLDPDYDEFSRFAWGLGNDAPIQDRETFGFDDYVALDEFTATA